MSGGSPYLSLLIPRNYSEFSEMRRNTSLLLFLLIHLGGLITKKTQFVVFRRKKEEKKWKTARRVEANVKE